MMKPNRRNWLKQTGIGLAALGLAPFEIFASSKNDNSKKNKAHSSKKLITHTNNMKLGAFSVSLSVRDINASKQFYETLGFKVFAGGPEKKYLIMKNENALIGLFQGMFQKNMLTFNPGWDENAGKIEPFDDVREIQRQLKSKGIKIEKEADEQSSGPAAFFVTDPDGNAILVDQHV